MGSNTRFFQGALVAMLLVAISLSGCVYVEKVFQPTPTPAPVITLKPTPSPTRSPTATPAPTAIVKHSSPDVRVLPVMDKGIIAFESYPADDEQYENITIVLANDGPSDAKKVAVVLTETDAHGGNMLVQQKFIVGDIKRGDRKEYSMVTEKHERAGSIQIKANLEWGESGEYYNPATFIDVTKSIIWMIKF